jgi:hypothetical protein
LDKRAGAISNPDNGNSYFSHFLIVKTQKLHDLDCSKQDTS